MAEKRSIRYHGRTAAGRATTGRTRVDDLGAWVEERWRQNWRWLIVEEDRPDGRIQVGGISRLDGTWWSER